MRNWPTVRLGELLRRSEETIEPAADTEYREITARLWGKGIVERGRILGAKLPNRRFVAHAGQFIVSRIDARNGAMGIVPDSLEGALVTNDFPLFNIDEERLYPQFLEWLSKTPAFVEMCIRASEGTTNRVRLKEHQFYELEIPLPALEEQRRIVTKINDLAHELEEARLLRAEANESRGALWRSALGQQLIGRGLYVTKKAKSKSAVDLLTEARQKNAAVLISKNNNAHPHHAKVIQEGPAKLPDGWTWTTLGSVLTHLIDCINDTPNFADTNTGYLGLKSTNVRPYVLDLSQRWYVEAVDFDHWNRRESPQPGDIILTREAPMGFACKLPEGQRVCLTQRLMLLRADKSTILPDLLLHLLNSPIFQDQVREHCRGLTTPHIRVQDAPNFLLPLPPWEQQEQIVEVLSQLQTEVEEMNRLQNSSSVELEALLPSILDRAFRGEL